MPPKAKAPKLHELATEIPVGFKFTDTNKLQFVVGKQFATGGFGRIYVCNEVGKREQLCLKIEPIGNGPLFVEIAVFQRALRLNVIHEYCKENKVKTANLPHLISCGLFEYKDEKMRFLIMPKYFGSLESIREKAGRLDVPCALNVAKAVARALSYLSAKKYTHGDIKAANILLPTPSEYCNAVLADFGLSRMASSNVEKADKKRAHNGTAIFTSLDAHRGFQPSYRGDIEILVYNIIYWIKGTLPWLKVESTPAAVQAEKEFWEEKGEVEIEKLIGKEIGIPIGKIYRISRTTKYTENVNVDAIIMLLDQALSSHKKSTERSKVTVKTSTTKRIPVKKVAEEEEADDSSSIKLRRVSRRNYVNESSEESDFLDARNEGPKKAADSESTSSSSKESKDKKGSKNIQMEEEKRRPIPGLSTKSAKNARNTEQKVEKESENEDDVEQIRKGVDSALKRDKDQLRKMVPGLRNLQKGRRSEIISQIAKKHAE